MKKLVLLVFAACIMLMTGQLYGQQGKKETEKTKKENVVTKNKAASRDSINKNANTKGTKKTTTVKKTQKKGDGTKKTKTTKETNK